MTFMGFNNRTIDMLMTVTNRAGEAESSDTSL